MFPYTTFWIEGLKHITSSKAKKLSNKILKFPIAKWIAIRPAFENWGKTGTVLMHNLPLGSDKSCKWLWSQLRITILRIPIWSIKYIHCNTVWLESWRIRIFKVFQQNTSKSRKVSIRVHLKYISRALKSDWVILHAYYNCKSPKRVWMTGPLQHEWAFV